MTAPTAPRSPAPHLLDDALKRRSEVRATIRALADSLESASPGREGAWMTRVAAQLDKLREDVAEHIERTEAPGGLYDEIRTAQPRLTNQVRRLVADHEVMRERVAACCDLAARTRESPDPAVVKSVRDEATHLVGLLQRHRQRGSDLIFEAYETDIGGTE